MRALLSHDVFAQTDTGYSSVLDYLQAVKYKKQKKKIQSANF